MFAQKLYGISKLLLAEMRMLRINGDPFKSIEKSTASGNGGYRGGKSRCTFLAQPENLQGKLLHVAAKAGRQGCCWHGSDSEGFNS